MPSYPGPDEPPNSDTDGPPEGEPASAPSPDAQRQLALDQALRFLGYRARSVREVRTRLERYGHPPEVIDDVVRRLLDLEYLDDATFALALARDYLAAPRPKGRRAIMAQLRGKGIAEPVAQAALERAMEESEESPEERVLRAAERWCRRLRPGDDRDRARQRLWGHLSRAGFDGDLIRSAIEQVLPE
jgi:regulatory protein